MTTADLCADDGFGYYVVLQLPNVTKPPLIAGPFSRWGAAWRAMGCIETAYPAVRSKLAVATKVSPHPEGYPTVRDPALPSGAKP